MTEPPVSEQPVAARKWSPSGLAGVALVSYLIFAVLQIAAAVFVLVQTHPEFFRGLTGGAHGGSVPPVNDPHLADKLTKDLFAAPYLFFYALLGDGAMFLAAIWLGRAWLNARPSDLGFTRFSGLRDVVIGMASGLGLTVASDIAAAVQAKIFGPHAENVMKVMLTHHGASNFIFDFLSVAVIAPLAEEYLFRGIIFTGLAQWIPVGWAAVASGVVFAVAHLDPWSAFPLAVIGVGLALLYRRTGSLWPNIIAHATVNSLALVAVYFLPQLAT
jgi:membrane protease YdiL (CAAX protease family)